MFRIFDIVFSIIGIVLSSPLIFLILIACFFDTGSPVYRQKRIGKNKKFFFIIKFRTMSLETKSIPTHLINENSITKLGKFLRNYKLDELPQLWNVLVGNMSLVGTRPCLPNQRKLIIERKKRGIFRYKPGITGLAQITGVTMKNPVKLANVEARMIKRLNLYHYFYYILKTLFFLLKIK